MRQRVEYEPRGTFLRVLATSALQYLQYEVSEQMMFFVLQDTLSAVDLDCHMA
jgi:hypothetical protein